MRRRPVEGGPRFRFLCEKHLKLSKKGPDQVLEAAIDLVGVYVAPREQDPPPRVVGRRRCWTRGSISTSKSRHPSISARVNAPAAFVPLILIVKTAGDSFAIYAPPLRRGAAVFGVASVLYVRLRPSARGERGRRLPASEGGPSAMRKERSAYLGPRVPRTTAWQCNALGFSAFSCGQRRGSPVRLANKHRGSAPSAGASGTPRRPKSNDPFEYLN